MKLIVDTLEIKTAINAILGLEKKIPNDLGAGDAKMTFIYHSDSFSLVSTHDYFTISIAMKTMQPVGTIDPEVLDAWDGNSQLMSNNMIGLADPSLLASLANKLIKKSPSIHLSFNADRKTLTVDAEGEKTYTLPLTEPRKLAASYSSKINGKEIVVLDAMQFQEVSEKITSLGRSVKPTVSKPAFGNVCICALDTEDEHKNMLQMSASSDTSGYSIIYDLPIKTDMPFTALVPKGISEALSAFASSMPSQEVTLLGEIQENLKASTLTFSSDEFTLQMTCMNDAFPFTMLNGLVSQARDNYCVYRIPSDALKDSIGRVKLFATGNDAVIDVKILDGGAMSLAARANDTSRTKPAKETINDGTLIVFPDGYADRGTTVKANVIMNITGLAPSKCDIDFAICNSNRKNVANKLAFIVDTEDGTKLTAIMLGIRGLANE